MLEKGNIAPDIALYDDEGNLRNLSEWRGKKVILYFYPKDNTSGCSKQACEFNRLLTEFTLKNAVVLGISRDGAGSHQKFREKFGLAFTLLSDPDLTAIKAYDVWREKKMAGKVSMGVLRSSFLIDENGVIAEARYGVKAAENPAEMLGLLG